MRLRNLILAGVTALSVVPAAASAQSFGWGCHDAPPQLREYGRAAYDVRGPDEELVARGDRLREMDEAGFAGRMASSLARPARLG